MNPIKEYKKSVKIKCKKCGNEQVCGKKSRCHREETCSKCLQEQYERGEIAYWG